MVRKPALLLLVSLSLSGCHSHPVPVAIPNRVAANEIAIYQAYLRDSFSNSKPPHKMWYVDTETWPDDEENACDERLAKEGVGSALLQALRTLGTARYLVPAFDIGFAKTFDAYRKTVNGVVLNTPFTTQSFSRVAFSPDGRQAFFHVTWLRGGGDMLGGSGYDILASQQGSNWHFRSVGCVHIID
jgi:hypothetical protein